MAAPSKTGTNGITTGVLEAPNGERERVFEAFRRWGYLEADLDPLGFLHPPVRPELPRDGEFVREARRVYSGTVGVEFMHIPEPERRRWIQERMEGPQGEVDQQSVLEQLIRADTFEQVLQQRYLGTKRFSLEGVTALIPLVDEILDAAGQRGAIEAVMGMSHRGRL
ncbi:MAG: 2-oxoglutarate dehydrogenase E1 component, partial [Terriglobales bacterium]